MEAWGTRIGAPLPRLVLVHRSYADETGDVANNERLEFLDNLVLPIVAAQKLYEQYPDVAESDLPRMRAATVPQQPLAAAARRISLGGLVFLGKDESMHGEHGEGSILSDILKTLIGVIYLTSDLEEACRVILERLSFLLVDTPSRGQRRDRKTILIECSQAQGLDGVFYEVEEEGPDYQRMFTACVFVSERPGPTDSGQASSKEHAENTATQDAMSRLLPEK